jgi:hypothetical protein
VTQAWGGLKSHILDRLCPRLKFGPNEPIGPIASVDGHRQIWLGFFSAQCGESALVFWWRHVFFLCLKVGLGNVTNTSDADKPVSILQHAALDTKLAIADTALMLNRRELEYNFVPAELYQYLPPQLTLGFQLQLFECSPM